MYTLILSALMAGAPPTPPSQFNPVLHVKVIAPDGVRVTLRPGSPDAKTFAAGTPFGLRPGYLHRIRIDGLPNEPNLFIDPSIEVRNTLFMPINLKSEDYPAPITITADDITRILAGGMVTKIITLEDPEKALPEQSTPDQPIERELLRGDDPLDTARKHGRILAIVRLGGRSMNPEELAAADIPGIVQFPGEALQPAAHPPTLPARHFQLFDPILGPRVPMEELVQDGGDVGPRIGIGGDGHLGNVDTTDTAIEYRAGQRKRTAVSNRICIFAPRFVILRQELSPSGFEILLPPLAANAVTVPGLNKQRVPSKEYDAVVSPAAILTRLSPRGMQMRMGVHELELFRGGPLVLAQVEGVAVKATVIEPIQMTQYRDQCKPNDPLVLIKTSDPREAQPGDVITITIKFVNYGSKPAREVIVADSLSPRLEYVAGSSRGDRPATFTQQMNDAGSAILRWNLVGELAPGQSGIVQFQAKVR
jgi:uncharacterized repeat protein (TIGR01451 family)